MQGWSRSSWKNYKIFLNNLQGLRKTIQMTFIQFEFNVLRHLRTLLGVSMKSNDLQLQAFWLQHCEKAWNRFLWREKKELNKRDLWFIRFFRVQWFQASPLIVFHKCITTTRKLLNSTHYFSCSGCTHNELKEEWKWIERKSGEISQTGWTEKCSTSTPLATKKPSTNLFELFLVSCVTWYFSCVNVGGDIIRR